ncbi:MAG: hypothetical protein WC769_01655 [Thermodesulfovibrionales bacterium]
MMNKVSLKARLFFSDPLKRKMRQQPGFKPPTDGQSDNRNGCPSAIHSYVKFLRIIIPVGMFVWAALIYLAMLFISKQQGG